KLYVTKVESTSYNLENPFRKAAPQGDVSAAPATGAAPSLYEAALTMARDLIQRPLTGCGRARVTVQTSNGCMTVWERMKVLTREEPNILYQNWGPELDGASIVTGILNVAGRDVAIYGHDFTQRAGSMDSTN